ncbi:transducin wd40 repeat-like superfamily protein [Stylonychia lemnae]|uniref:Transducin wd40 repeat-like superfamily protein n=1 Tax=Stylonychia lemnae TaxID=5949 RepID=A0A078AHQ9_STYLE|nr:transducin wd40 repeat-like superfamily protein [Stylonychia lemnae]|eukprot:CDW80358.1 transducin wd40 repeat-like superfamily protein [Stylonychia lemnae]
MAATNFMLKYFQAKKSYGMLNLQSIQNDQDLLQQPKLCRDLIIQHQFEMLTPKLLYDCKPLASRVFTQKMNKSSLVLEVLTFNNQFIVSLLESGRCSIHDKHTQKVMFFNKSQNEQIRSIFLNRVNESIIVVSVTKKDEFQSLKCRTVTFKTIEKAFQKIASLDIKQDNLSQYVFLRGEFKGQKLFKDFALRWPDFIEFDEINQKIITKHSQEEAYRVWSLATYQLQYVLKNETIAEFKICNGVMLLLHQLENGSIPMTMINIHTGEEIQKFEFSSIKNEIEFLEQFNEKIMIKQKDKNLKIYNSWDKSLKVIEGFDAPEAFIFLYEKEKFLTLKEGKIEIWSSEGEKLTNFDDQVLSTKIETGNDGAGGSTSNYIVSVSLSKRYLFSYFQEQNNGKDFVNIIDIQNEKVIARVKINQKIGDSQFQCRNALGRRRRLQNHRKLSSLFYDEQSHELFIGYTDGDVEIWSPSNPKITKQQ